MIDKLSSPENTRPLSLIEVCLVDAK